MKTQVAVHMKTFSTKLKRTRSSSFVTTAALVIATFTLFAHTSPANHRATEQKFHIFQLFLPIFSGMPTNRYKN
jgi:amino acid permease